MIDLPERHHRLQAPDFVQVAERDHYLVCCECYFVRERSFEALNAYEIASHNVLHLAKVANKKRRAIEGDAQACDRVREQVVPDLTFYAMETSMTFDTDWWTSIIRDNVDIDSLSALQRTRSLSGDAPIAVLSSSRDAVIESTANLADVCDKNEHLQDDPAIDIATEIVDPLMMCALDLGNHFDVDLGMAFKKRLDEMASKYGSVEDLIASRTRHGGSGGDRTHDQ